MEDEIHSNGSLEAHFKRGLEEQTETLQGVLEKGFEKVAKQIESMNKNLLDAATGKDHVQLKIIMPIIKTLCGVIVALIVWFTGIEPSLPSHFSKLDNAQH